MYQAITTFLLCLALAGVAASLVKALRLELSMPATWILIFAAAVIASAASIGISATRHAGTGFTTSHGWPRPFYVRYLSETGVESHGWSLIYFLGNTLVFTGIMLILWTAWKLVRR
jgi:hypothetical protein